MTMNITSKQMEITPAIRQHVADRLAKLEKWQTHLINPHIILSKEPQGFVADATINTPNGVLVASGKHEDMYTAITAVIFVFLSLPDRCTFRRRLFPVFSKSTPEFISRTI